MIVESREKVIPELATTWGFPEVVVEELYTSILLRDMVQTWKDRKFVQDELICQSCGTRKPHRGLYCLMVKARMNGLEFWAIRTERRFTKIVAEMRRSLSDAARRKLLKTRQ